MSKNLKTTNSLTKFRNFLLAVTVLFALLVGFGIFYEHNFREVAVWGSLEVITWLQLAAYVIGSIIVYAWLVWLVALLAPKIAFLQGKKLLIIAIDCIICAIIVIIVKSLIMPLIPNPAITRWDMLAVGLLFFVALCCIVADYLKKLL